MQSPPGSAHYSHGYKTMLPEGQGPDSRGKGLDVVIVPCIVSTPPSPRQWPVRLQTSLLHSLIQHRLSEC